MFARMRAPLAFSCSFFMVLFVFTNALRAAPNNTGKNIELGIPFDFPPGPPGVNTIINSEAGTITSVIVPSSDVPKAIPDNNPAGIKSVLRGPNLILTDVNLILKSLPHTCIPDLHIELTSPAGTTATLVKAASEGGILKGLGCPANFTNTVLDDQTFTNLRNGVAPSVISR
jgi:hypothetical protein